MAGNFGGLRTNRNQQRQRALGVVLCVALIGVIVVLAYVLLNQGQTVASVSPSIVQQAPIDIESTEVLVPIQSIEPGTKLEPMMFRKESRPKQGLPRRIVSDYEEIKGTYARSIIAADAPLLSDYLTEIRPSSVITPEIPDGYRAVTIRVDVTTIVEGWAKPGSRVDVKWVGMIRGQKAIVSVVQNAKILSAEMQTQNQMDQVGKAASVPTTVTLLVTAYDADKILLYRSEGTLSLSLRGDNDTGKTDSLPTMTFPDTLPGSGIAANDNVDANVQGTMKIDGLEYKLVNNKWIPASELERDR
jgi:pilus assembly protein CpaB